MEKNGFQFCELTRFSNNLLDEFESVFKKERNEIFETFQLLSQKQLEGETQETFHLVLSGLAARYALGTLKRRISRDVFIVNISRGTNGTL